MNRMFRSMLPLTLTVAMVAMSPLAVAQPAVNSRSLAGEYDGDDMRLVLAPEDDQSFSGTVSLNGQEFPLKGSTGEKGIHGNFYVEKDAFPFTITVQGDRLTFETEGTKYALTRAARKSKNPLQRGGGGGAPAQNAPVNPLGEGGGGGGGAAAQQPAGAHGAAGGVGVALAKEPDGTWKIAGLKPGGPAEESGMKVGEILVAVDDKPVAGLSEQQVGALLGGAVGSTVRVSTMMNYPGGGQAEMTREVERADVSAPAANRNADAGPPTRDDQSDAPLGGSLDAPLGGPMGGPRGPGNDPDANANAGAAAGLEEYRHRSGVWSLHAPGGEWRLEESADGNTATWKHPSGAMIFVTLVPDAPARDAEAMFNMVAQGVKQAGANIGPPGRWDGYGAPAMIAQFSRQRNGVNEHGQLTASVANGTGIVFQMSMPESKAQEFHQTYDAIARSFRVKGR